MDTFAFTILDIASLLNLTVRHRGGQNMDLDRHGRLGNQRYAGF